MVFCAEAAAVSETRVRRRRRAADPIPRKGRRVTGREKALVGMET
jgi:hypothetical protein